MLVHFPFGINSKHWRMVNRVNSLPCLPKGERREPQNTHEHRRESHIQMMTNRIPYEQMCHQNLKQLGKLGHLLLKPIPPPSSARANPPRTVAR